MLFTRRIVFFTGAFNAGNGARLLSNTVSSAVKQMPPRPTVNEEDLTEAFLKGSGPGGQKINKTSSAVQLRHEPTGVVVKSQATRSRTQNRKLARQLLAEKLDVLEKGSESRAMVKGEVKRKKKASASKKSRRKYRQLAESEATGNELEEAEEEEYADEVDKASNEKLGNEAKHTIGQAVSASLPSG